MMHLLFYKYEVRNLWVTVRENKLYSYELWIYISSCGLQNSFGVESKQGKCFMHSIFPPPKHHLALKDHCGGPRTSTPHQTHHRVALTHQLCYHSSELSNAEHNMCSKLLIWNCVRRTPYLLFWVPEKKLLDYVIRRLFNMNNIMNLWICQHLSVMYIIFSLSLFTRFSSSNSQHNCAVVQWCRVMVDEVVRRGCGLR